MENPFRPGNGIEPPYLADRSEYTGEFLESMRAYEGGLPRNIVLYGLRGTGKTVLMRHFSNIAENRDWLVVEREFNKRFSDENNFAEAVATDVVNLAAEVSILKKVKKAGRKAYEYLKPKELSVHGISYHPFYKTGKELLEDYLKDLLVKNWEVFKKDGKKGVVFLYDEFHAIADSEEKGEFPLASFLGALSYAQREGCKYYLAISGLPNMKTNLKESKTYTERMFTFKEVGNLSEDGARRAILEPLSSTDIELELSLVNKIIKRTQGYPFFIQFYCYHMVNAVLSDTEVSPNSFSRLEKEILKSLDAGFFEDRFNKATKGEQELLFAMAEIDNDIIAPKDISKKLRRFKKTNIFKYLEFLIEKSLIYKPRRGGYAFTLPLFKEYLLRRK